MSAAIGPTTCRFGSKYADIEAPIVPDVGRLLERVAELAPAWHVWVLTNYSALWPVKADLERMGESR